MAVSRISMDLENKIQRRPLCRDYSFDISVYNMGIPARFFVRENFCAQHKSCMWCKQTGKNYHRLLLRFYTQQIPRMSRQETDTMGSISVENHRQWGAQTQRSIENFPIFTSTNHFRSKNGYIISISPQF